MFFDFDNSSDLGSSHGKTPDRKAKDDLTPGLFDSGLTEEEEMDQFLREIRSSEKPADDLPAEGPAGGVPAASAESPAECIQPAPAEVGSAVTESAETEPAEPETEPETAVPESPRTLTPKQLKRAAMAFLASLEPSALAIDAAAGGHCRADAAAFWMEKGRITRTVIAQVQSGLEPGGGKNDLFDSLKIARMEREVLEQEIRRTEPGLRDSSQLFTEFSDWNYEVSKNPAYRECLQKIRKLEHALYHGTRLERLLRTNAASEMYLIVPENTVAPDYPLNGCGLVYIRSDLSFELILPADRQENVSTEHQLRLALNIAASDQQDVLFANGIHTAGGKPKCGPLPRRRHLKS
ncbi:MAG: hypothetical protein E7055_13995 [Lentisphaerae bacterium]|nr:hypothetical protein [Lentisphaerota bacterium]